MNDDKDKMLQACNSLSAEELFAAIERGELTLLDLVGAGLDDEKLIELQELMAVAEDELWAKVQAAHEPALCRRYLQAYPTGRYARRCTVLRDRLTGKMEMPPVAPPAATGSAQPARPASSVARQGRNAKPQRWLKPLIGITTCLVLLAAVFSLLRLGHGNEDEPSSLEQEEVTTSDSDATEISDTVNKILYNEVERSLLDFHVERAWSENGFSTMRTNLEQLYAQKDGNVTVYDLLLQLDKDVIRPFYGDLTSQEYLCLIKEETDPEKFNTFIEELEEQIKNKEKERKWEEQVNQTP